MYPLPAVVWCPVAELRRAHAPIARVRMSREGNRLAGRGQTVAGAGPGHLWTALRCAA